MHAENMTATTVSN